MSSSHNRSQPINIPNNRDINNIDNYKLNQHLSLPLDHEPTCECDCCFPPNPPNSYPDKVNLEEIICQKVQMSPSEFSSYHFSTSQ